MLMISTFILTYVLGLSTFPVWFSEPPGSRWLLWSVSISHSDLVLSPGWASTRQIYQINFLWCFYLCSRTMFSERHHDTATLCQITDLYLITLLIIRWQGGFQVQEDLSPCLGTIFHSWVAFFKIFTEQTCPVQWKHRSALTQIKRIYEGEMSHT